MPEVNNYLPLAAVPGLSDLLVLIMRHWSRFWPILPIPVPSVFLTISRLDLYWVVRSLLGSYK